MATKTRTRRPLRRHTTAEATLGALCRGLVGYVSYLATCRSSPVYSEYLLYEPILRIGQAQGYDVDCEYPVDASVIHHAESDDYSAPLAGDKKKIDFNLRPKTRAKKRFGIEVKWARAKSMDVTEDVYKLLAYEYEAKAPGYLLVFGKFNHVDALVLAGMNGLNSQRHLLQWDGSRTRFAARWYQVF